MLQDGAVILGNAKPYTRINHLDDGAYLEILRDIKSGPRVTNRIRMGPNHVHAFITHPDMSITDLGVSKNLMTNVGVMYFRALAGGGIPAGGAGSPATAISATSLTGTATPWTASNLATPQLGLAGFRVYASVTGVTTPPVYANIISNTTSVLTLDQWWTAVDGVGTTPSSTCGFIIGAGGLASVRFMGLTTNAGVPAATDTVLTGEITTNGGARALVTYTAGGTPSAGSGTYTLAKTFSFSGTFTAIHKIGLFTALSAAGADPMIFESTLNQDANVGSGDTLSVTDTVTQSG